MLVTPDPIPGRTGLAEERLRSALAGGPPGWRVEVVPVASSTNDLVRRRAEAGEAEGLVVVAERQTAGRGRLGRRWETPPGAGLTFSVLLRPRTAPDRWPWLGLLTGYAVRRALADQADRVALKWPNDVLVGDRKVAGILLERLTAQAAAVVGVGINVSTTEAELPVPTATSLALATGRTPDRTDLLAAVLSRLAEEYAAWQRPGGERALRAAYLAACGTVGRTVRVDLPTGPPLTGRATGVDEQGRLLVATDSGEHAVGAGDVVHVRTPGEPPE